MGLTSNFQPQSFNTAWIETGIVEDTIQYMEDFGFYLCDKRNVNDRLGNNSVTVSQIRNIFGEIKRIVAASEKDGWETDFLLLRTKIAYNAARVISRSRESRIKMLQEILEKAHKSVKVSSDEKVQQLVRFSQLLEGIVAYHKVYGGKD